MVWPDCDEHPRTASAGIQGTRSGDVPEASDAEVGGSLVAGDLTPLSPAVFHILLSLGEGERHGYALKREISPRTGGKLKLGPGVLYGSINKMLELGLIEESDARPDPQLDDERRRYYQITPYGRKVAQAEAARMRELVQLAALRFGVPKHA